MFLLLVTVEGRLRDKPRKRLSLATRKNARERKKSVARESSNSYFSSTAISPITCNGLRNKEGSFYSIKFSNGSCQW